MTEKLKPCPFCGKPAILDVWYGNNSHIYGSEVRCSECYARSSRQASMTEQDAQDKAVAAWNRRVES